MQSTYQIFVIEKEASRIKNLYPVMTYRLFTEIWIIIQQNVGGVNELWIHMKLVYN